MSGVWPEVRCCFHFFFTALVLYIQCSRGGYSLLFEYTVTIVSTMFTKLANCDWWPHLVNPKLSPKCFLMFHTLLHLALHTEWAIARDFGMTQILVPHTGNYHLHNVILTSYHQLSFCILHFAL